MISLFAALQVKVLIKNCCHFNDQFHIIWNDLITLEQIVRWKLLPSLFLKTSRTHPPGRSFRNNIIYLLTCWTFLKVVYALHPFELQTYNAQDQGIFMTIFLLQFRGRFTKKRKKLPHCRMKEETQNYGFLFKNVCIMIKETNAKGFEFFIFNNWIRSKDALEMFHYERYTRRQSWLFVWCTIF